MKELALISKTTPAVVSFNYAEIDVQLEEVLKKYGGLLFTDETVAECKKTIAELKKGKKSLNDFKIKTKKLLTEDITKFEDQCKLLSDKFDTVINPIGEQAEAFEVKRKQDKENEILAMINKFSNERELDSKYSKQLVFTEQMLNKGTTIKAISVDLTKLADTLLFQQNMEKSNIELIKSKVELANSQYGVTMPESSYLRMLEYSNVTEIAKLIIEDAEKTKIAAERAEAERVAIEVRKAERLAKQEADRVAEAAQRELERVATEAKNAERERLAKIAEEIRLEQVERLKESERVAALREKQAEPVVETQPVIEPLKIVPPTKSIETEIFIETYKIEGTEADLNELEDYLNTNGFIWSVEGV